MELFPKLYQTRDYEREAFGEHWCGPDRIEREYTLVAKYLSPDTSDGQSVDVYISAMPARFCKLSILPGPNSIGKPQSAYTVTFGSDCHSLAAQIAEAISEGMLGFSDCNDSQNSL